MLNIATEQAAENKLIIHVGGELTIESVAELRESLLEAFAEPWEKIRVDGAGITNMDFFGLQLLCSAHRTAVSRQKVLSWHNGRPASLDEVMQVSGFTRHCGCSLCPADQDCLWI
nr:STAS domain-containing protein [uncultured Desulfobulbus sp.]